MTGWTASRRAFLRTMAAGAGGALVTPHLLGALAWDRRARSLRDSVEPDGWDRVPGILARIVAPTFRARDFVITSYGAKADGRTDCTSAIRQAISACSAEGGGRVVVPAGGFLTGPIHLRSNVNLHVADGATLRFSTNPNDYLPAVFTRFEGMELMGYSP